MPLAPRPITPAQIPPGETGLPQQLNIRYAMFQDTHVMMLLGFGFLYTLLRRYAWSGVGYNFFITVAVIEWAVLALGFWQNVSKHRQADVNDTTGMFPAIPVNIEAMINADYIAATVLISFGAVLGRVSPMQCLVMVRGAPQEHLAATVCICEGRISIAPHSYGSV